MAKKRTVAIGLLGTQLDGPLSQKRWSRWRPTVGLCQQEDLVIDRLELLHDEPFTRLASTVVEDVASVSPETSTRTHVVPMPDPWDFASVYAALHDFAQSYPFDTEREEYLVHITTGSHVAQICLFLLTESRHLPARLVQSSPGSETRSIAGTTTIVDLDLTKYERLATRFRTERATSQSVLKAGIETKNAVFNATIEEMEKVVVASREPLLLLGPTGAGKSALARRAYALKHARRLVEGPWVEVNCATLRGDAAMSTLFGHEKGAFTGALAPRKGLLLAARGGMLFLDEIGELGLDEQAMLLHAIEEQRFRPLGADKEVTTEFQLVAGTNRDLRAATRRGTFREDLLARIDLWTFRLPALRERREDIEPNIAYELERAATRLGRRITFRPDAQKAYLVFALSDEATWPGNFRDLGASVLRMATLSADGVIDKARVSLEITRLRRHFHDGDDAIDTLVTRVFGDRANTLDRFDRAQLEDVLLVCRDAPSLAAAGRVLFAVSRTERTSTNDADRLRKYLARFELDLDTIKQSLNGVT